MGKLQERREKRLRDGLALYVKHLGWLHATPKPRKGSKRKADDRSRMDRILDDKLPVRMPPNPAPHLISWLIEIGLTEKNGMGESALSWREINEWQAATGVALSAFEARLMRELSKAYVGQKQKSDSENSPPPWAPRM